MNSSGSPEFDVLRDRLRTDKYIRHELEFALRLNVERVNPSERANRFGSGAAVEWIVAATAFSSGLLAVPAGHNADGFDLIDIRDTAQGLWSIKNTTKKSDFRLSNGMGGAGKGFVHPVILLSPALPGLTYADPRIHFELEKACKNVGDAIVLPFAAVQNHVTKHPECVAICEMPTNHGRGKADPWMDYVKSLLQPDRFPQLSKLFMEAAPIRHSVSGELERLAALRDQGVIDDETFNGLVKKI
jgi:hypothetical protein